MSFKTVAFFNNKGGVGKTSLVYHLAWKFSELGYGVVAADLDPQANLTSAFLAEDRIEQLWSDNEPQTLARWVKPLRDGTGDIENPKPEMISDGLSLLPGDLSLSGFEDELSHTWSGCLDGQPRAFRVTSAFWRLLERAAKQQEATLVLIDLGPSLGALNRAALIAADHVVFPLAPDLFSLLGLRNLGPTLSHWRKDWTERLEKNPDPSISLPKGSMEPAGYVLLQHSIRYDRPTRAYEKWMNRIPPTYKEAVLGQENGDVKAIESDPNALALLKHYRTLMPLAQDAHKPIFHLTAADGASGAHYAAARNAGHDFELLAKKLATKIGMALPSGL
jgi:chromosome partitioning protein